MAKEDMEFQKFPKIKRLNKDMVVTEKIHGTNGVIYIEDVNLKTYLGLDNLVDALTKLGKSKENLALIILSDNIVRVISAGSRNRWLRVNTKDDKHADNYGFAQWVQENGESLAQLGEGWHYGEWYGKGIQHGYGLDERRFALFATHLWNKGNLPDVPGLDIVPVLYKGQFSLETMDEIMQNLRENGSVLVPGFDDPEGIVVFYEDVLYKDTFDYKYGKWAESKTKLGLTQGKIGQG